MRIGLQTMVFAAAEPGTDRLRIVANVDWLERAQLKPRDRATVAGNLDVLREQGQAGDNSNTQYALLGLNAASEAGVVVKPEVWALSRAYFEQFQNRDGGWAYTIRTGPIDRQHDLRGHLQPDHLRFQAVSESRSSSKAHAIHDCGKGAVRPPSLRGIDWLASHFQVSQNVGHGADLEALLPLRAGAGRPAGRRPVLRPDDWYRLGAEELVHDQNTLSGFWRGAAQENELVATSFALLFLAKGRAPVLINKLRHLPSDDWNNDPDDVRNLVAIVSRDWKNLLTWQIVDPSHATVAGPAPGPDRLLQRPRRARVLRPRQAEPPRVRRAGRASCSPTPAAASRSSTGASSG